MSAVPEPSQLAALSEEYDGMFDGQYALDLPRDELLHAWLDSAQHELDAGALELYSGGAGFALVRDEAWDSDYFSMPMVRIVDMHGSCGNALGSLLERVAGRGGRHVSVRLGVRNTSAMNACVAAGFELLHSKVLLRATVRAMGSPEIDLRDFAPVDRETLRGLLGESITNNRFASDSAIDPALIPGIYESWFDEISSRAPESIQVAGQEPPVGCVCSSVRTIGPHRFGFIDLVAVAASARGTGTGTALLSAAVDRLLDGGCRAVYANTSSASIPSLMAFQKAGFRAHSTLLELKKDLP